MTRFEQIQFFEAKNNLDLPFAFRLEADQVGPEIVIYGGIHGNEPAGVEAIIKFCQLLETAKIQHLTGSITFILGNPAAYILNRRFVDCNLNRAFDLSPVDYPEIFHSVPKSKTILHKTNYEQTRVREIQAYLGSLPRLDYSLDLHSVSVGDLRMAICHRDQIDFLSHVSSLDLQWSYTSNCMSGTTMDEGMRHGAWSYVVECGNHSDPIAFKFGLEHILRLLSNLKMINEIDLLDSPSVVLRYIGIQKIPSGKNFKWQINKVKTGTFCPRGTILATIQEADQKIELVCPQDCYLLMPCLNPDQNDIDAAFLSQKQVIVVDS
jgi:Succinylglutamate desuccinylase / Aspartoacylase family